MSDFSYLTIAIISAAIGILLAVLTLSLVLAGLEVSPTKFYDLLAF